jgi:hypothetical protein
VNGWLWEARGCLKRKKKDRPFEKQARPANGRASLSVAIWVVLAVVVITAKEQVRHYLGVGMPGMVQARQTKAAFERFQK